MISITESFNINLTPEELASEFCEMDCDNQAKFFNLIYDLSQEWHYPLSSQLHSISTSLKLKSDGRWVMEQIGIYSKKEIKNESK